jgi:hypothetical protein
MLTCLAMALSVTTLNGIPALSSQVEAEARALNAQTSVTPAFMTDLDRFSTDAELLSASLRAAGVAQDLPCIFHGISQDAHERITTFQTAQSPGDRDRAFTDLRALLSDAILIAPMAASAAADIEAQQQNASAPAAQR